jgi:hypothetical protein
MKKVNKFLLFATLGFGLSFSGCNNDQVVGTQEKGNTNVAVTLALSVNSPSAKALPNDYNFVGEWAGKDSIKSVTIFIVGDGTVTTGQYELGDFTISSDASTKQVKLTPKKAIKTTAGTKNVYALINGSSDVVTALAKSDPTAFEAAYSTTALKLTNSGTSISVSTSADKLAAKNGVKNEIIVMTNTQKVTLEVEDNVTEAVALAGTKNRASVQVERSVARVMVTTSATSFNITSTGGILLGAISDIRWVLAQGENSFYIQKKSDYSTPNYGFIPSDAATYESQAGNKYDYSGLFENYTAATLFGGTSVATLADYSSATLTGITAELNEKLAGKFVLPTTHQYVAPATVYADPAAGKYKKGNTTYVLVRAKFTPASLADGATYTAGNDFFVGANGKFYSSKTNAQDPAKGGVAGQTVAKYIGGKALYYAWVNPDELPNWYNSPVVRNNIYHIHITGFKNLGTNWNPLYPEDPEDETPTNPDPKPNDPDEPENPIDPKDPLTTPVTYMSVDVAVLPWKIHSYSIDLGI